MSEVHRYDVVVMLSEAGGRISYKPHGPAVVMAEAYDALAAQRDEGLAREAELRKERDAAVSWQETVREYSPLIAQRDALQQRLAEADKLTPEMVEAFMGMWAPGYCTEGMVRGCWAALMKARPGRADIPQAAHPAPEEYDDVLAPFLGLMRRELHANAAKGDRPSWLQMTPDQCLLEIYYHVSKLQKAVRNNDPVRVAENTADVANMAMMMADIFGLLGRQENEKASA